MSDDVREVRLGALLGQVIRDADGRRIGRLAEVHAELEQHPHGNDYVVTELHVANYGRLETLGGAELVRQLLHRIGRAIGFRVYRVPWTLIDFSDPSRLRATVRVDELAQD